MKKTVDQPDSRASDTAAAQDAPGIDAEAIPFGQVEGSDSDDEEAFRVEDKRHWNVDDEGEAAGEPEPRAPSIIDDYRRRAEDAEEKLHDYIEAHKRFRQEQEDVRVRLQRDVERRVRLRFGELVADLLKSIDHLDLALRHAEGQADAAGLVEGVRIVRDEFLSTLLRAGVERIQPDGEEFDPEQAEALRLDPVDDPAKNNRVTETLQPGYRLGETVIRPARVAVGKHG